MFNKTQMPSSGEALKGRSEKMPVPPAAVEYVIASGSAVSILRECKKMMEKKDEPAK